jgi:hypothetical protein
MLITQKLKVETICHSRTYRESSYEGQDSLPRLVDPRLRGDDKQINTKV